MRLIDAEELERLFNAQIEQGATDAFDAFDDALQDALTIDAAPVVHGKWECGKPCPCCGEDRFKGLDADIWADWEPPYCPNCGADMREVDHDQS